ncbi:hypothetical protein HNR68_000679 [Saccharopolyspora hordei]|uniref:Uncharacterized protein n=1 Tax=Saccharopolyspora hordei TaxID=1838 RepID=A0A853AG29_9PSEU|nr:hypothetical protein [Saccharopolyspora hordei]NYI82049.1 hypothetical protein [Saccharopolyspora hordei]
MVAIATWFLPFDQVGPEQLRQRSAEVTLGPSGERGQSVEADVRSSRQAHQAEQPRGLVRQGPVGPGEHRSNPDFATRLQGVEPVALVPQLFGQLFQREVGELRCSDRDHAQREGKPATVRHDLRCSLGFFRESLAPQVVREQVVRFGLGEHVQRHPRRTFPDDEVVQPVAARHHHQAGRRSRQQWSDLVHGTSVVEEHQHVPVVHEAAEHRCAGVVVRRDAFVLDAERCEEESQDVVRFHGLGDRVEPAQVDVQLAVREAVPHAVSPVHGEGRFPHAGSAVDGRQQDHTGSLCTRQQRGEHVLLHGAVHEVPRRSRELPRYWRTGHGVEVHVPMDGAGLHDRPLNRCRQLVADVVRPLVHTSPRPQ